MIVAIMRDILKIAVASCLVLCIFSQTALAIEPAFWFKAELHHTNTTYEGKYSNRGQCHGEMASVYNYLDNSISSQSVCTTVTSWGEVSEGGIVIPALSLDSSVQYKMQLDVGQRVLASPNSRRLYIAQDTGTGTFKIGYIENVNSDIAFDTEQKKYVAAVPWTYLPVEYENVAFSNNSYYVVGVSGDSLKRTSLRDMTSFAFKGTDQAITVASTSLLSINNEGTFIAGANQYNSVMGYMLTDCQNQARDVKVCESKMLLDQGSVFANQLNMYVNDDSEYIEIFSYPFGSQISRLSMNIDYDSLNRYVSYAALGDSFSSGEGAGYYELGTDGTDEFPDEKCHQSNASYPYQYFNKYMRWADEWYEPNINGDMVISPNSFTPVTCSGAHANDLQPFYYNQGKWSFNAEQAKAYAGQFEQAKNMTESSRTEFRYNALGIKQPGRTLQAEFLKEYKPTFATIGIGGNDVGFGDVIKACVATPLTCPQASIKKKEQAAIIKGEFNKIDALYRELHNASPETRLYAVGYPMIVANDDYKCGANVLLDAYEREFIKQSTKYLNQVIRAAAHKNGLTYVNFEDAIGDEGLCGTGRGMNGVKLGDDNGITIVNKNIIFIGNESYHPTSLGQSLMGDRLIEWYGELDKYNNSYCNSKEDSNYCPDSSVKAPAVPSYFGNWHDDKEVVFKQITSVLSSPLLPMSLDQYKAHTKVSFKIFSDPINLGEYSTDSEGSININLPLPPYLEPGYHTLYATGTSESGTQLEYEMVVLYLPEDTQVGPCSFMPYSNLDQDADGIDDACDPQIEAENQQMFEDVTSILTYPNPPRARPVVATIPAQPNDKVSQSLSSSSPAFTASFKQPTLNNFGSATEAAWSFDTTATPNHTFEIPAPAPLYSTASHDEGISATITPWKIVVIISFMLAGLVGTYVIARRI